MKKLLTLIAVLITISVSAQTISTFCGTGMIGQIGFNGEAATAIECYPVAVCVDSARNVYYIDAVTNTINKISAAFGTVTRIGGYYPGSGAQTSGYAGDGGPATSALFNNPTGIAVDDSGNVYIADEFNFRVRKIVKTNGTIVTIAGNGVSGFSGDHAAATSAMLGSPYALALDDSNNVYITDQLNVRIRKINKLSGEITTIAGNGTTGYTGDGGAATSATMNQPQGIAADDSGNVYIADRGNTVIRKYNKLSAKMSTMAGNGTPGFTGDGGVATSAELNYPTSVDVDDSFAVYITDQLNNRVRKVTKSNLHISTVAGTGVATNTGDGQLPTSATLNTPYAVCVDDHYNYYIAVNGYLIRMATNH